MFQRYVIASARGLNPGPTPSELVADAAAGASPSENDSLKHVKTKQMIMLIVRDIKMIYLINFS